MNGFKFQRHTDDEWDLIEIQEWHEGEEQEVASILVSVDRFDEFAAWVASINPAPTARRGREEAP